jgi:hypothetical protein
MARAVNAALDPAWTADGLVVEHWLPVSPASGRFDAFEWRVPVADMRGPLIEHRALLGPSAVPAPGGDGHGGRSQTGSGVQSKRATGGCHHLRRNAGHGRAALCAFDDRCGTW